MTGQPEIACKFILTSSKPRNVAVFCIKKEASRDGNDIIEKMIIILRDNDKNIIIIMAQLNSVSRSISKFWSVCFFFHHSAFFGSHYLHLNSLIGSLPLSLPSSIANIHFMANASLFVDRVFLRSLSWHWVHRCAMNLKAIVVLSYYIVLYWS